MSVPLTASQTDRIRLLMKAGGYADESAVMTAALDLLESKQKLHAMIQEGIDAAERGEIVEMDEAMRTLRGHLAELRAHQPAEASA